ncbi:hypothetical protein SBOR_0461 [Sclerotinia borealis F-4128]|uniref:Hydrophobin n=1 Tax=Sclerotinia borealis (strain F-4128) TaxID=1432307 RepID=W9CTE2_SCLBF|nr:hypothetical protein SBOR_0461 [Sclerotinia borealis F-4128]
MHAPITAMISSVLALTVAAYPSGGGAPTSTWGSTSPTGVPACAGAKYTCKSSDLLGLLTCTNVLNGVGISIPISIGKRDAEGAIEARTGGGDKEGDYCCTSAGLLTLSCLNVANGVLVLLPISIG